MFVHDNAPAHQTKRVTALGKYNISRLDWPAGSLDLTTIERQTHGTLISELFGIYAIQERNWLPGKLDLQHAQEDFHIRSS